MKVYIGYDPREHKAAEVAAESMARRMSHPVYPIFLRRDRLQASGMLTRPVDARGGLYDLGSGAPQATEFALSRFLVPILAHEGWALFVDCDVLFLDDVWSVLQEADKRYAVQVVKHTYEPAETTKMDGAVQTTYRRKNWSSVVLWNCDHPANRRLNLQAVNTLPGRDLHAFSWLHDSEIGELSPRWNWLVNVSPPPADPAVAHFTLGGPWLPGWKPAPYDDLWEKEACL